MVKHDSHIIDLRFPYPFFPHHQCSHSGLYQFSLCYFCVQLLVILQVSKNENILTLNLYRLILYNVLLTSENMLISVNGRKRFSLSILKSRLRSYFSITYIGKKNPVFITTRILIKGFLSTRVLGLQKDLRANFLTAILTAANPYINCPKENALFMLRLTVLPVAPQSYSCARVHVLRHSALEGACIRMLTSAFKKRFSSLERQHDLGEE